MFPLFRDRTRRLICRSMFLLLGVLPTGAVLAWSVVLNGDGYHHAVCQQLAASLGYDVRAQRVTHPRNDSILIETFELVDPETGDVLFSSPRVEILEGEHLAITAQQPELKFTKNYSGWSVIERRLRLGEPSYRPLQFRAKGGTISWPEGKQSVSDCSVEIDAAQEGNVATAKFHWGEQASPEPVRLQMQRSKSANGPVSLFKLWTGASALPCTLLAAALDQQNRFGAESTYRGTLTVSESEQGWIATIEDGVFTAVDLNALASEHFPGNCTGLAEIHLTQARIQQGQIVNAQGTLTANQGITDRLRLNALAQSLNLQFAVRITSEEIRFQQVAVEFHIDDNATQIYGRCDETRPGVVLRSADGPILMAPPSPLPRARLW